MSNTLRIWLARLLIAPVIFFNLQCAILFILEPARFSSAYELTGVVGVIVISGFGILFLMWNVPYIFALINPIRFRISLFEAVIMQTIGLLGEILLFFSLSNSGDHNVLASSIERFIWFDAGGWLFLVFSAFVSTGKFRIKAYST